MTGTKDKKNQTDKEVFTKEDFLNALTKVTTSVPKPSDQEKSKTSGDHPSDDYNEKHTR